MINVVFEGASEIKKPPEMTDEQCSSAWAQLLEVPAPRVTEEGQPFMVTERRWLMHYQPSKEDLEALNAGRGFWLVITQDFLSPHFLFTLNEQDEGNF